jgi:hypothetical protein
MPALDPIPDLGTVSIDALARMVADQRLPPVENWAPSHCGDSGIRIARDGSWLHEGRPIRRPEMVRLFSRILRREADGRFVLVTPAEMLDVEVEDCPFLAVELKNEGEGRDRRLAFRLNSGDVVIAGPDHPIRIEPGEDGPHPRLVVRGRLDAAIARPVYYELAAMAIAEDNELPGLWSDGAFFALDAA